MVSLFVTATGFKPVTPTSVVWYSIQLSYAAIALFCECKDRAFFLFRNGKIRKNCIGCSLPDANYRK